jgi:hypothetical protein
LLSMISNNTVDRDEDAEEAELRIKQIIAASEPMPLDDVFRKGGAL